MERERQRGWVEGEMVVPEYQGEYTPTHRSRHTHSLSNTLYTHQVVLDNCHAPPNTLPTSESQRKCHHTSFTSLFLTSDFDQVKA